MSKPRKKAAEKKVVLRRDELAVKPLPVPEPAPEPAAPATAEPEPPAPKKKKPGVGTGQPKSLGELGERVKRSLYAVIDGLCALPADLIDGARRIVRQVPEYVPELVKSFLVSPRISEAIAKRIERADRQEGKAQEKAAEGAPVPDRAAAEERLQAVLAGFRAKGLHVELTEVDGVPTLVVVRPELADAARALAAAPTPDAAKVGEPS